MLSIFRKNQFLRSLLLFPLALLLNLNMIVSEKINYPVFNHYFDSNFFVSISERSILNWLLYAIILFVSGVLMNRYVIINRLSNSITLFPGLFYILICSIFPSMAFISTVSVGVFLFLLLISNLFYTNIRFGISNKIFNTGIYQGIMTVFFAPFSVFFLYEGISLNSLRTLKRIDLINLLNGALLPAYFLLVFYFLFKSNDFAGFGYRDQFGFINLALPQNLETWLFFSFTLICVLIVLGTFNKVISKKGIQTIRKINILAWSIPIGIIFYFISNIHSIQLLMVVFPAFAFFISEWVLNMRSQTTAEMVFILILILGFLMPWVVA